MPQTSTETTTEDVQNNPAVGQVAVDWHESELAEEQQYRASAYSMLAALLREIPEQSLLNQVAGFAAIDEGGDEMAVAMSLLGLAAEKRSVESIDEEYHALFIGLGRGELVPYASFYLTGFLMEKPLGDLRDDLIRLGFERASEVHEPEDHVAALCEVMVMLIQENADIEIQRSFYVQHIDSWLDRFFTDMAAAKNAVFYRAVARFGAAFMGIEKSYLLAEV